MALFGLVQQRQGKVRPCEALRREGSALHGFATRGHCLAWQRVAEPWPCAAGKCSAVA